MNFFYIIFLLLLSLNSCGTDSAISEEKKMPKEIDFKLNVPYSPINSNQLDIFYRKGITELRPVVIYVFGGGWTSGSKEQWKTNHIALFDSCNMVSVAIDYTLITKDNGVKHPAQVNDVAQSIRWVYDNIKQYGGDRKQIYLMGASAGALLVDLIATNPKILQGVGLPLSIIKGVVSIDGGAYLTLDPIDYILPDTISPLYASLKELKSIYQLGFGYTIKENMEACPYYYIKENKEIPPFLLISQGANVLYRFKPNNMMYMQLKKCNIPVEHHIAQDIEHSQIFYCIGTPDDKRGITSAIVRFMNENKNRK